MLAVYLLWDTLGLSVLAGVGLLVILVPVNGYLAFHQQNLQKQNLQWKDRRVKLIHEILSGIKVLPLCLLAYLCNIMNLFFNSCIHFGGFLDLQKLLHFMS